MMKAVDSASSTGALKRRRKALNPYNGDSSSYALEGCPLLFCVILLYFIGFSVTMSHLTTSCSKFDGDLELSSEDGSLRASSPPPLAPETSNKSGDVAVPSVCTDEQSSIILRQLPAGGCSKPPWKQACSFTKATTRIDLCRDNYWMREFYANARLKSPFHAFFVGYPRPEDRTMFSVVPMDLLHVGTHNPKFQTQKKKWAEIAGLPAEATCQREVKEVSEIQNAKVFLVTPFDASIVNDYKQRLEISEKELEVVADGPKIDDAFFASKLPAPDPQIHYLRYLNLDVERFNGLKELTRINTVWYLEFTLESGMKGGLDRFDQKQLLQSFLPENGFICYWAGNENLWRINNCWQDHYSEPMWSNVACVNARILEVRPLLDSMEKVFVDTMADSITF